MKLDFLLIKVFFTMFKICTPCFHYSLMFYMYVYAYQVGVLKLYLPVVIAHILLPHPVMYMYIYLPCVAVMLDRWSNSPVTVYRHARNSPLL